MNHRLQFPKSGLYAITPDTLFDTRHGLQKIESILKGGAKAIQLRQKNHLTKDFLFKIGKAIKTICVEYEAVFIINDDVDLALKVNADGVHLGKNDCSYEDARMLLGHNKLIGVSCYNSVDRAVSAAENGADYIALGSFFRSPTKVNAPLCSTKTLSEAATKVEIPIVAIGGVSEKNGQSLIENGANLLACISSIFKSDKPKESARSISVLFER